MKRTTKRFLSVFLALVMLITLSVPAFAKPGSWTSQSKSEIPVIRISGDGEALVDENGEKVFHYKDFGKLFSGSDEEEGEENALLDSTINILMPFLLDGLLNDNWEPYYENLQKEITELFENSLLDKNGNPQFGTGLTPEKKAEIEEKRHKDLGRTENGQKYYVFNSYWFSYDWRLDPIEIAEEFKDYIDDVMAATKTTEVGIIATCLGTNIVTAYLASYPEHAKEHIRGVAFDGSVVGGSEMLSEVISGKFDVDGAAINRILMDCNETGLFNVDGFINSTLDMLDKTGALDRIVGVTKEWIYYKLVKGVTSALALSTFYTWPNYWGCVSPEDYETAKEYVFGPEGSAKRTEYAGLIRKLDNYDTLVRQRIPEILDWIEDNGINFGVISKYGFQILPVCETNYLVSDQFASVKRSSFGAVTGTIYNDLSDEYIASRNEAGAGKYISPDGQIDASTCRFPNQTWFIKGSSHSNWSDWESRLLYDIATSEEQVTIDNSCWPSQFVVYSYTNPDNDKDGEIEAMTTENCDTENWEADEKAENPETEEERIFVGVLSIIRWLIDFVKKIFKIG